LWRSRRAIAIETGLFRIHAEILRERKARMNAASRGMPESISHWPDNGADLANWANETDDHAQSRHVDHPDDLAPPAEDRARVIAHCFLRLAHLDSRAFDRLNRYEVALWRQTVQILFALQMIRRRL
jgi:hypothetical protein